MLDIQAEIAYFVKTKWCNYGNYICFVNGWNTMCFGSFMVSDSIRKEMVKVEWIALIRACKISFMQIKFHKFLLVPINKLPLCGLSSKCDNLQK